MVPQISDMPATKGLAKRAVSLIAEGRKSEDLQYFLRTGETHPGEMDIGEAYQLFQISDRTVDDDSILAAFQVFATEDPGQIETYQRALRVIANESQSLLLKRALGEDPTPENFKLNEWPVGLRNIGNTCYLNSLLQFYFTVKPFRDMVLDFEQQKMELDDDSVRRKKVGSRTVSRSEIERAQKFMRELRSLFEDMTISPTRCITPGQELARLTLLSSSNEAEIRRKSLAEPNLPIYGPFLPPDMDSSNEDDSTIEHLTKEADRADSDMTLVSFANPETDETAGNDNKENVGPPEPGMVVESNDTEAMGALTAGPEDSAPKMINPPDRPPPVPPRPVSDKMRKELEIGAQQDVTEVINNVLFQAQCAIKANQYDEDGGQLDMITELFYGKTKSYITTSDGVRCKEEPWSDIKVDVARESSDIYLALDGAFDMQRVHIDGTEAEQHGTISRIPPILQIQIQRVQFDQVQMRSFKSNKHLELEETIYLDRYMDTLPVDNMEMKRQEKWRWKEELRKLEKRNDELRNKVDQPLPVVFNTVSTKLQELAELGEDPETKDDAIEVDASTVALLAKLEEATEDEIIKIEKRIDGLNQCLSNQFSELKSFPYHLYAVFIHRGSASAGHYWIYIFDFEKEIWREYNDEQVSEVKKLSTIFTPETGPQSPSPYFLVYIYEPLKERLTQPVHRSVREIPTIEQPLNIDDTPTLEDPANQTDRAPRPPTRALPKGRSQLANEVLRQDLEMPDAPPPYEEVACMNTEGRESTRPTIPASSSHHHSSLKPAVRGSWAKDVTDIPDVEW
ncbi:ubiquitin-specific protease ubp2 [Emydomyces testavorans]|uniref:Ubiquitin carboxyl-terminal hydrolase n=1 Tax=Emydomyces testavorans TaxID=2070801 RepID=A0AAF0IN85_9EURO|nr:ubiquitin-specific protease ubp2 [Emydomyces testavorans]